jgi:Protein of unknown function (DUF3800)
MSLINIYCDESCHLENDHIKAMSLGAIWCDKTKIKHIAERIRALKTAHGLSRQFEIKWTKVSPAKLVFYLALIDLFFDTPELHFRGVVVPDKTLLNHVQFGQDHDDFYYKMFFTLLKVIFEPNQQYAIYLDIKDTQSQEMVKGLHDCLCNSQYDFNRETLNKIQQIRSHESELIQLADLMIGALSHLHRGVQTSVAKQALIEKIKVRSGYSLLQNTWYRESKFNLLIWRPQIIGVAE